MRPARPSAARQRAPLPKEAATHIAVADALRVGGVAGWLWTHFPAGEERTEAAGFKLKRMGLKPGWSDFLLISPRGVHHWLELKRGKADLTPEQSEFAYQCQQRGVPWAVVRSFDEAVQQLTAWGALKLSVGV